MRWYKLDWAYPTCPTYLIGKVGVVHRRNMYKPNINPRKFEEYEWGRDGDMYRTRPIELISFFYINDERSYQEYLKGLGHIQDLGIF